MVRRQRKKVTDTGKFVFPLFVYIQTFCLCLLNNHWTQYHLTHRPVFFMFMYNFCKKNPETFKSWVSVRSFGHHDQATSTIYWNPINRQCKETDVAFLPSHWQLTSITTSVIMLQLIQSSSSLNSGGLEHSCIVVLFFTLHHCLERLSDKLTGLNCFTYVGVLPTCVMFLQSGQHYHRWNISFGLEPTAL